MKKIPRWLRWLGLLFGGILYVARSMDKPRHRFSWRRILGVLVLLGVMAVVSMMFFVGFGYNEKYTGKTNGCGVVFGAAVWKADQPSHALYDRTLAGIELYKSGQVACLVFSGGASTYGSHEVDVMVKIARQFRVPEIVIAKDYYGNNTLATIQNLKKQPGYVFISNDFHLARISLIAKKLGFIDYHVHGAEYKQGRYYKDITYFFREVGGSFLILLGL